MSEEKNRDELKNTKENDRDQAVPEVSESENASDTDNKNSDPGAKETSSRKKSDKAVRIISDNKNAGAAFAGLAFTGAFFGAAFLAGFLTGIIISSYWFDQL